MRQIERPHPSKYAERMIPKFDANGKKIQGRFVLAGVTKNYRSKLERGSIELPGEFARRNKAEAKRRRKADRRRMS
jgi:hypothetical protein